MGVATIVAELNLNVTGHVLSVLAKGSAKVTLAGGTLLSEVLAKDGSHVA